MKQIKNIKALIFDMDGTLVDSEINTEKSVEWLLKENKISQGELDLKQFHGITWESITDILKSKYPELKIKNITESLQHRFHTLFMNEKLPYIPGSKEFFTKSTMIYPTAIATSSNRESVEYLVDRMDVRSSLQLILSAEDYSRSKPDPECYLLAAQKLNVPPEQCIVFEDSIPGLRAAKSSGAKVIAITKNASDLDTVQKIADMCIQDYFELPENFFEIIK